MRVPCERCAQLGTRCCIHSSSYEVGTEQRVRDPASDGRGGHEERLLAGSRWHHESGLLSESKYFRMSWRPCAAAACAGVSPAALRSRRAAVTSQPVNNSRAQATWPNMAAPWRADWPF